MQPESIVWLGIATAGAKQAGALNQWGRTQPNGIHLESSIAAYYQHLRKLLGTKMPSEGHIGGNSLEVQWLGRVLLLPRAQVQSLVGELKSHKPHGVAKKIKRHVGATTPSH